MYVNSSQCKQNMGTHTSRSVQELIPENEKGDKKRQKYRREEDRKKKYGKNSKAKTRILQDLWPGLDVGHIHSALTTGAALQCSRIRSQ